MNLKLSAFFAVAITSTTFEAANAQGIYDKCIAAIDAGDTQKVMELANTVKRLKFPGVNAEKAETCLETAFGGDFILDFSSGSFIDGEAAAELQKEKDKRKLAAQKTSALGLAKSCHQDKLDKIERLEKVYGQVRKNSNDKLINELTQKACMRMHEDNPFDAILHPVCRATFIQGVHPDLDITNDLKVANMLGVITANSEAEIARIDDELDALYRNGQQSDQGKTISEILGDLQKPCE